MESLRKRVNVELVTSEKRIKKVLVKPTLKTFTIINEDLVMVQLAQKKIIQNKPLYIGFVVLELSKVIMYDFHYNHIQCQYGTDRARLLFTDTDSLCYQIETDSLYEDMAKNLQHTTPVRIPKPIPCIVPSTQRSLASSKMRPTLSLPKNLWVCGKKCIPFMSPISKRNPK